MTLTAPPPTSLQSGVLPSRFEERLDPTRIPSHIAIMMDGNRRWAKKRLLPAVMGHWRGSETVSTIVRAASDLGVKVLTLYSFSTENWNRSPEEISGLMNLICTFLRKEKSKMIEEGVRLDTIGDLSRFPDEVKEALEDVKLATAGSQKIDLVLALNYGSRDEISRAALAMAEEFAAGKISKAAFSEKTLSTYLDTAKWRDPELLIRTSGETRLSNFLLWQISYAEIYITKTLWPDFSEEDLVEAIVDYQKRDRRLGG
ncbi:MAG: di-trans,poly-cis-decaprenylcistransferase [Chlamydiales bacterium]|nr:di-trans,poly-cis-decaprenylcistransferase [Chlamydiales bacterium]